MVKRVILTLLLVVVSFAVGFLTRQYFFEKKKDVTPSITSFKKLKPFEVYSIENLSRTEIKPGKIRIKKLLAEEEEFSSYLFEMEFNPNLDGKTFKKTTGQINIPTNSSSGSANTFPLILMFRGYINQETYKTGDGTRNASYFFTKSGFITVSPDFLGFGGSDKESSNIFESRFQTYVTGLTLLKTLSLISNQPGLITSDIELPPFKLSSLFIWGHSNGGQIALTVLEVSGANYPTVLWAPVSKPFPYSVLFYTDVSDDGGKLIRKELSKFEEDYDTEKYSLQNFLERIKAPVQLNQGADDSAVPKTWSDTLAGKLKSENIKVIYNVYPGTDHNMRPSWDVVIEKDLEFYKSFLTF